MNIPRWARLVRRRFALTIEALEARWMPAVAFQYYQSESPSSIVTGTDGNLWFTTKAYGEGSGFVPAVIGEVNSKTTAVSVFTAPNGGMDDLESIINGPGGNLWFTDSILTGSAPVNALGSFNPTTHLFTAYPLGIANAAPAAITLGPDGNIWFTDPNNNAVGVFNPTSGKATEFAMPNVDESPSVIVAGPDGDIWFGYGTPYRAGGGLGRINPTTDVIATFPLTNGPGAIAVGSDGNIWFTDAESVGTSQSSTLGNINPRTGVFTGIPSDTFYSQVVTGPGGLLWLLGANSLYSVDPVSHATTQYTIPTTNISRACYEL